MDADDKTTRNFNKKCSILSKNVMNSNVHEHFREAVVCVPETFAVSFP